MQKNRLKNLLLALGLCALAVGCATTNNLESRKLERPSVYSSLSPEDRALVDAGKIKVGMPMDAVYIAWGKPSQVTSSESSAGALTHWIYQSTRLQEYRYWSNRGYYSRRRYFPSPSLEYDYAPVSYPQAEVIFKDGVVKEWRTFPVPPG